MENGNPLYIWLHNCLDRARVRLGRADALLLLALLGIVVGLLSGGVIVVFRFLVESAQLYWFPGDNSENYEELELSTRILLPIGGAIFLVAMFKWFSKGIHVLGVARVMERMAYHQGYLTVRGFWLQFVGAAVAIFSGHSVGREGPHVYLGAASGSLLGQWLSLPNNSIRTLVGCGTAAGIAASFNTPLAGVIFALEVVMMEYTIASFIPVILSAAMATLVSVSVFGYSSSLHVDFSGLVVPLGQVPMVIVLGLVAGAASALFNFLIENIAARSKPWGMSRRLMLAGILMGGFGALMPTVMGIGYDTVDLLLLGEIGLVTAGMLVLMKMLASSVSLGLGIPGGLIGPSLFTGAALGGFVGLVSTALGYPVNEGYFALLGMGAMMGASLQAPLAALTAIMELTHTPGVIMPGMLVIVIASLTTSEVFGKHSLFLAMLKASGHDYEASPVLQTLRRTGVAGVMSSAFSRAGLRVTGEEAARLLQDEPQWILIEKDGKGIVLLRAVDLVTYLEEWEPVRDEEEKMIELLEIPGKRLDVASVSLQATLQEALEVVENSSAEALYVESRSSTGISRVYGILTREMIESSYRH